MLIYANAVTQIWKRLAPSVGSWTEARNSHVALRAWGNLQPTDSTCTFLLLMFTARSSLEITGIIFLCLCFVISTCSLFFHNGGSKSSWIWDHERWTQFRSVTGFTVVAKLHPWLSWRVPKYFFLLLCFYFVFFFNFFKFFCSVPLLSAQAGSHCGIIHNFNPFCYVNVLHSLNLRCTFVWNFNVLTFWSRIVRTQFTGNHHLLRQKDSYLRCY